MVNLSYIFIYICDKTCLGIWEAYGLDQVGDEFDGAPEFDQGNVILWTAIVKNKKGTLSIPGDQTYPVINVFPHSYLVPFAFDIFVVNYNLFRLEPGGDI